MQLLEIFGAPVSIILGFPSLVFVLMMLSEARNHGWRNLQWKYPVCYGGASLIVLILLAIITQ
jgi:ABC-type antimicrobial peptide transport system permease subunit